MFLLSYSVIALATMWWLLRCSYLAYLTPLASVPNAHPLAPFSKLWLLWLRYSGQEHHTRHLLHKRLGAIIRLGPQELSVNCIDDGVSTIYNGNFDKSPWFASFVFYGQLFMFTMLPSAVHSERKRMMSFVYSKSYIQNSENLTAILDAVLLERLTPRAKAWSRDATEVDLHPETQALSMDITSCYLCGLGAGSNFVEDVETRDYYLRAFKQSVNGVFWHEYPQFSRWAGRLGFHLVPAIVHESQTIIEKLCSSMCEAAHQTTLESLSTDETKSMQGPNWPVVYAQLRAKLEEKESDQSKVDALLAAEMLDHMIAGNDGAGNTLSFLIWQLSKHPEVQKQLRDDFQSIEGTSFSAQAIDSLPLLDATLMETMRLHPAGLGPHLRIVPKEGTRLGSYSNIPSGTTVSASAWALHRNEEIYPEPEEWRPERWMEISRHKEMRKWFFGFGTGGRTCIGNHFAIRIIKAFVCVVYSQFETSVVNDDGLKLIDGHMGRPSHQLLVRFRELSKPEE